ncbi:hypothetical protein J2S00_003834 [Caldalkalibacillus uzonensis]|uniref:Uncharacterized protein n=1 Tax=Caldalkalibacillus uzonensis TaxID=353224 RepID=A0ABU0CXW6_9BACI|nr:hypothetical protein [Caldalkalibacillus uzonensis]
MRNILDATPKALKDELYPKVRAILDAPDVKTARLLLDQVLEDYEDKAAKAMEVLETGFDDATAACWRKMMIEPYGFRFIPFIVGNDRLGPHVMNLFINRQIVVSCIHGDILNGQRSEPLLNTFKKGNRCFAIIQVS